MSGKGGFVVAAGQLVTGWGDVIQASGGSCEGLLEQWMQHPDYVDPAELEATNRQTALDRAALEASVGQPAVKGALDFSDWSDSELDDIGGSL
jgi:hypothetical protein